MTVYNRILPYIFKITPENIKTQFLTVNRGGETMNIWKRVFSFALTFALFLVVIGSVRCPDPPPEGGSGSNPPEPINNLHLGTWDDGCCVKVLWDPPNSHFPSVCPEDH